MKGRESLDKDPNCGRPTTVTNEENIDRVFHIMMDERHVMINQVSNNISVFPWWHILKHIMKMCQADHITQKLWLCLRIIQVVESIVSLSRTCVGLIWQRNNIWSEYIFLQMLKIKPKSFHLQWSWWSQFFRMQKGTAYWLNSKEAHHQWGTICELVGVVTKC